LVAPNNIPEVLTFIPGTLTYGTVYHNGMGRYYGVPATKYENGKGFGRPGPVEGRDLPEAFLTPDLKTLIK